MYVANRFQNKPLLNARSCILILKSQKVECRVCGLAKIVKNYL